LATRRDAQRVSEVCYLLIESPFASVLTQSMNPMVPVRVIADAYAADDEDPSYRTRHTSTR
jgi:hypothetical protein